MMHYIIAFSIIGLGAFVHACFWLSVSTLTMMSGHALGKKRSQAQLVRLIISFLGGSVAMTALLISISVAASTWLFPTRHVPPVAWAVICGLLLGLGIAAWLFYFKKGDGATLWIPRHFADYLVGRSKRTRHSGEAFGLGLSGAFGELLFTIGPLTSSGVIISTHLPAYLQPVSVATYTAIAVVPLSFVAMLIGRGVKISRLQYWREKHKRFLQFLAGSSLVVLALYLYVNEVAIVALHQGL